MVAITLGNRLESALRPIFGIDFMFPHSVHIRRYLVCVCCLVTAPAWGVVPDAGLLRQQIEQADWWLPPERVDLPAPLAPLPQMAVWPLSPAAPLPAALPAPLPIPVGTRLQAQGFLFEGNRQLSAQQLAPVVAAYLHRPLHFEDLAALARAVEQAYRAAGWVARAYLPQQAVANGVLTIRVVEAGLGQVWQEALVPMRLAPERAGAYVSTAQQLGQPIQVADLARGSLLLGDVLGMPVGVSLRQGATPALTDVVLRLPPRPWWVGEVAWDNGGVFATGAQRVQLGGRAWSWSSRGDWVQAHALLTEGSDYVRLGYLQAVGHTGLRLGMNATMLQYRLLTPLGNVMAGSGHSDSLGLEAMYPLRRTRRDNLNLRFLYDYKHFDNQQNAVPLSRYRIQTWSAGVQGERELAVGQAWAYSVQWTRGLVDLDGSPNQMLDAATTRVANGFNRWRYAVSYTRDIDARNHWRVGLSGQFADNNLDSAEQFYVAGGNGVRAYPNGEPGAAEGHLLQLAWRQHCQAQLDCTLFYDAAVLRQRYQHTLVAPLSPNRYALQGVGAALAWQPSPHTLLRMTWAHRLGNHPNPLPNGQDQDGTLSLHRWWWQASWRF